MQIPGVVYRINETNQVAPFQPLDIDERLRPVWIEALDDACQFRFPVTIKLCYEDGKETFVKGVPFGCRLYGGFKVGYGARIAFHPQSIDKQITTDQEYLESLFRQYRNCSFRFRDQYGNLAFDRLGTNELYVGQGVNVPTIGEVVIHQPAPPKRDSIIFPMNVLDKLLFPKPRLLN